MPSQFNTLVQGQSISTITPQQILAAGEPIFLDIKTTTDINSINSLIQAYARVHAPTYGQPIPNSGLISTLVGDGSLLTPTQNQVRRVYTVSVTNTGGGAPITAQLSIGGVLVGEATVAPGQFATYTLPSIFSSTYLLPLTMAATSGTSGDLTTSCASVLVIQ